MRNCHLRHRTEHTAATSDQLVNRVTAGCTMLNPAEALTVQQALRSYTHGSVYAVHEEQYKGTLSVGKLGDLVVLSDDIFQVSPDRIKDLEVRDTMVSVLLGTTSSRRECWGLGHPGATRNR